MGFGLGLLIAAVICAGYGIFGHWIDPETVRTSAEESGFGTPIRYVGLGFYFMFVNSILEEFVWRWFVFRRCETLFGGGGAVVASALFFTLHHVFVLAAQVDWRVTILGSVGVFTGGALSSWCYLRYRSVWPGYLSHAIVDLAILGVGWME